MNPFAIGLGALVALSVSAVLIAILNTGVLMSRGKAFEKLMSAYTRTIGAGEAADLRLGLTRKSSFFVQFQSKIDEQLAGADIQMPAGSFIGASLGLSFLVGLASAILLANVGLGILIGVVLAYFALAMFLPGRLKAKSKKFANELPQVLQIVASGLRAGLTFTSAISATAQQDRGEVGRQFRRAMAEVQYGSDIEDALKRVAERMHSADLGWLVLALQIQREVGGSLAGILEQVAETIRSRADVQREIRVLSAEGRLSGYVLIGLPIVSFVALLFIRYEYVAFFWTQPLGMVMLGVVIVMMVVGYIWMNRAVKVDS